MCPICFATAAWIVAGVTSTGGISALAIKALRRKNHEATTNNENYQQGEGHGQEQGD
jgi:hypothetical protein